MPTVRWLPRCAEHRYYYRCLERFFLSKKVEMSGAVIMAQILVLLRKRRTGGLDPSFRRRRMFWIIACTLGIVSLRNEINRQRITVFYPSQEMQILDDAMFDKMFRFRRADFYRMIAAMRLSGKSILLGRKGKVQYFPADNSLIFACLLSFEGWLILADLWTLSMSLVCLQTEFVISSMQQ